MTSREFCYWLQGFFEIRDAGSSRIAPEPMTPEQVDMVRKHLALVFKHEIDPSYPNGEALNAIHNKTKSPTGGDSSGGGSPYGPPKMRC